MMRVLVTGGAGFIGSHLCRRLLNDGHEVICVDNFYTGNKANLRDIEHQPDGREIEVIRHDITFPLYVEVDRIYHLACPASPIHYQRDPVQTVKTSVHGTINMLGLAKRTKARILLASTSEVYGDPAMHPQTEDYWGNVNNLGLRACYDEGKRCAETLFMDYYRQHDVDIRIARIFNTYGPKMALNDGRVVSNFIVSALTGKPMVIYGDGSQTRSFCYVDDMVTGLMSLMERDFIGPFNLGNPEEITILRLAETIGGILGLESPWYEYQSLPDGDPARRKPDITRAKELLFWEPGIDLNAGLNTTIQYFREELLISQRRKAWETGVGQ